MTSPLHRDELSVGSELVRRLVAEQFPSWSGLDVLPLHASGSTNAMFRLGDDMLVRMPRQPGGTRSIEQELSWAPWLSPLLPVDVPDLIAIGNPGHDYPERWSVVRWLDGMTPEPATSAPDLACDLADVVAAFRNAPVPPEARADPGLRSYRAGPLAAMDDSVRRNLTACRDIDHLDIDLQVAERVWDAAMDLPCPSAGVSWLHADLLAENLLVNDDRLSAVLDFGALCIGDPTVDLVVAWEVLDATAREHFRRELAISDDQWLRGRAWALAIALMTFPYYWTTMPQRCAHRLVMARQVLADAD